MATTKKKKKKEESVTKSRGRSMSEEIVRDAWRGELKRSVSVEALAGRALLSAALRSRFGEGSWTTWPSERFSVSGRTAEACVASWHAASPFKAKDVIVWRNEFTPRPPKRLPKLYQAVRKSAAPIVDEPNAGGSSEQSEAVSFATLAVVFEAKLVATEMAVAYSWSHCKKIDYLAVAHGKTLGVSVTRAYRHLADFEADDARRLLNKKLLGLWMARRCVSPCHAWDLGVLHVWCAAPAAADLLAAQLRAGPTNRPIWPLRLFALADMPPPLVILTHTSHTNHVIFKNEAWLDAPAASSFADATRRARRARQATYAALAPHRWTPPAVPRHLHYFYDTSPS